MVFPAVAAIALAGSVPALASSFDVTTTANSGAGSLRQAILSSNATPGLDSITFHIGSGAQTITPSSALPTITDPVQIFGTTQPGFSSSPLIELRGTSAGAGVNGLTIATRATGTLVWALAIDGFGGDGIRISGAGGNGVQGTWLGNNSAGTGIGNGGVGVHIVGSPNNTIDGRMCLLSCSTTYDEIVRNGGAGVKIEGSNSKGNVVARSFIGNVFSVLPNASGVWVTGGASGNRIGGTSSDDRNFISGNLGPNVVFDAGATGNVLEGSSIGLVCLFGCSADGGQGVVVQASGNTIGGTAAGAGNFISGNAGDGVELAGSSNAVQGNRIGTTPDGSGAMANQGGNGVRVVSGSGNTIGGTAAGAGNVISGNTQDAGHDVATGSGVEIDAGATATVVQGNMIGTNAAGSAAVGNGNDGIRIDQSTGNTIGGTASAARNVISGNGTPSLSTNGNAGVELDSTQLPGNAIEGNYVGTNAAGTAAIPNRFGVVLNSVGSEVVGGASAGAGNVVSGNNLYGIYVVGSSGVEVLGNLIGTDATGSTALGNGGDGVFLGDSDGATIGRTTAQARNVISGNGGHGVALTFLSMPSGGNVVEGDYIGTNAAGTAALPNSLDGVLVTESGSLDGDTIGGTAAGASNVVSGNGGNGILVQFSPNNTIAGNLVGTDAGGTSAIGNAGNGIDVSASSTGNSVSGNVVSGNTNDGVVVEGDGTSGNVVSGNEIGTDASGASAIPNTDGVFLDASDNTVGGTAAGAGNVISGNSGSGVVIFPVTSSPTGNVVQGNRIGTNAGGTAALGNALNGVLVFQATSNTIGGSVAGAANLISGNGRGVLLSGESSTGNTIQGNLIGTNAAGTAGLGNQGPGVRLEDGSANLVGGTVAAARNVISGNDGEGVDIEGGSSETVEGNFVGTDATGLAALGNADDGVFVNGSPTNAIGGKGAAGNVISGNGRNGVEIANTTGNKVLGNDIGTAKNGSAALPNAGDGVLLNTAASNVVGGKSTSRNVISGNTFSGVEISGSGSTGNKVLGNDIGTAANGSAALPNGLDGVLVSNAASHSKIGGASGLGDVIAFNGGAGVFVASGTKNATAQNSIFANGGLGIDLGPAGVNANDPGDGDGGPNLRQNYPVVSSAASSGGSTTIQGTLDSTPSTTGFTLEFFSSPSCDGSGFGEGKVFVGALTGVSTNASGSASFTATFPVAVQAGSFVTATATSSAGNTSEFSACRTST